MLRVTILGLALAVGVAACTSKEGASNADTGMGGMAPAGADTAAAPAGTTGMSGMDTMGAMAPESTSTTSAAGAIDTMANKAGATVDTMSNKAGQMADKAKAATGAGAAAVGNAMSGNAPSMQQMRTKLSVLSKDQVEQLQTALNNDGCDVGTADGMLGSQTLKGAQCSMKKHNVSDLDSLYQALNLNFQ